MTNLTQLTQIPGSRSLLIPAILVSLSCGVPAARAERPLESGPLVVAGKTHHSRDMSAVVAVGEHLIVASDEGATIDVLEPTGERGHYRVRAQPISLAPGDPEIDIEALAYEAGTLYVLGSHSLKRRRVDAEKGYAENRGRVLAVSPEPHRQRLFRLRIDEATATPTGAAEWINLRPILAGDALLGPFAAVPAVENGINLEGLAIDGESLVLGFRSPVLREGHVPVLWLEYATPQRYEMRFVRLGGAGIRSLARVTGGFLVLARPERGGRQDNMLYFWNGLDLITTDGSSPGRIERLARIDAPAGGVPEGVAVISEDETTIEILVLFDGIPGGQPTRMRIRRPGGVQLSR